MRSERAAGTNRLVDGSNRSWLPDPPRLASSDFATTCVFPINLRCMPRLKLPQRAVRPSSVVLDQESPALRAPQRRLLGGATRWWLTQSLRSLQRCLRAIGASLVLRQGRAARIVRQLAVETGAHSVFWNEIAQAPYRLQAQDVAASLEEIGIDRGRAFDAPGNLAIVLMSLNLGG